MATTPIGLVPTPNQGGYQNIMFFPPIGANAEQSPLPIYNPAGPMPPGTVPTRTVSYRTAPSWSIYAGMPSSAIIQASAVFTEQDFTNPQIIGVDGVTVFSGRLVVDRPTKGLPTSTIGKYTAITVPEMVYRVICAGSAISTQKGSLVDNMVSQFYTPAGKSNAAYAAAYSSTYSSTYATAYANALANGNPPAVAKAIATAAASTAANAAGSTAAGGYNQAVGVARLGQANFLDPFSQNPVVFRPITMGGSSQIVVTGNPQYVTYVAMDSVLFRDLIITRGDVFAFMTAALGSYVITSVSSDQITSYLLRYALVTSDDKAKTRSWALAESYGVKPGRSPIVDKSLQTTSDASLLHYYYDLNNPTAAAPLGPLDPSKKFAPAGGAYDPSTATKMAQTNKSLAFANGPKGYGTVTSSGGFGSSEWGSVGVDASGNISAQYLFTSPKWTTGQLNLVGYDGVFPETLSGFANGSELLVKAAQAGGLTSAYDSTLNMAIVMYPTPEGTRSTIINEMGLSTGYENPTEKAVMAGTPNIGPGLLNENPGSGVFPFVNNPKGGASSSIALKTSEYLTGMTVSSVPPRPNKPYQLLEVVSAGATTKSYGFISATPAYYELPGIKATTLVSFESTAGQLISMTTGMPLYDAFSGRTPADPAAETFPFGANITSLSAGFDLRTASVFVAVANNGHIDIYKNPIGSINAGLLVRDITKRTPVTATTTSASSTTPVAPATYPTLLVDQASGILFLFFMYKGVLLCKPVNKDYDRWAANQGISPDASSGVRPNRWAVKDEQTISNYLQQAVAHVVHPGSYTVDANVPLQIDIGAKTVVNSTTATPLPSPFTSYGACSMRQDKGFGPLYVFIQAPTAPISTSQASSSSSSLSARQIIILRSVDCTSWDPVTFSSKSMYSDMTTTDNPPLGASVACFVDSDRSLVILVGVLSSSLVMTSFSNTYLESPSGAIPGGFWKPVMIYGTYTNDMKVNGVAQANYPSTGSTQAKQVVVPEQQVTAIKTISGSWEVFFRDTLGRLHAIGSTDLTNWMDLTRYDTTPGSSDMLNYFPNGITTT